MTNVYSLSPEHRIGDWIQTYSGTPFWPLDPRPEEVNIIDIAHALSMMCRYSGHCKRFYSIAEHSVLVSQNVPEQYALWGLLHDAAEAYSSDIPRPLKRQLSEWAPIEENIMRAVCLKFGLAFEEPPLVKYVDYAICNDERDALMNPSHFVKYVDYAICNDERDALMNPSHLEWGELPPKLGVEIFGLTPFRAKSMFLRRYEQLVAY